MKQRLFANAWQTTKNSIGLNWVTVLRTSFSVLLGVGLVWAFLGWPEAMNELILIALYTSATAVIVLADFLIVFLWNLWLAPYRILNERIDGIEKKRERAEQINKKRKMDAEVITTMAKLLDLIGTSSFAYSHEKQTRALVWKNFLIQAGIVPEKFRNAFDHSWKQEITAVLPYIVQYGTQEGILHYRRDMESNDKKSDVV